MAGGAPCAAREGKRIYHLRDKLNAEGLALPWVKVEKDYVFDAPPSS
jgi:predicted dithiol-disulfide oxidoreductase (DUF899 family)